jgi:hypothetical protein
MEVWKMVLKFTTLIKSELTNNRINGNTQHGLTILLRPSKYSGLAGYEDAKVGKKKNGHS